MEVLLIIGVLLAVVALVFRNGQVITMSLPGHWVLVLKQHNIDMSTRIGRGTSTRNVNGKDRNLDIAAAMADFDSKVRVFKGARNSTGNRASGSVDVASSVNHGQADSAAAKK